MNDDGSLPAALLLAALAGWVDAAGVASSSGVFLSFMSGNTTDLAASLVHGEWWKAATIAVVIVLFVAGVAAGEILRRSTGRRGSSLVLALESVLLAFGGAIRWYGLDLPDFLAPLPLVFAMGLQNAAMHRVDGIGIGLTYVTGTLVEIGRTIAGAGDKRKLADYNALWFSLAVGAALGAWAMSLSPPVALSIAAGTAAALALTTDFTRALRRRR
jgi:uncharacterized membrane protein YoaK (UPF0700 family)